MGICNRIHCLLIVNISGWQTFEHVPKLYICGWARLKSCIICTRTFPSEKTHLCPYLILKIFLISLVLIVFTYNFVLLWVLEDRVSVIGGHFTAALDSLGKAPQIPARTRPPITTHVLDVSRGSPAAGVEVRLEMWKGSQPRPLFCETGLGGWVLLGSSSTDKDGRIDQLINIDDVVNPGVYRISFNTGKYCPSGFFPCVSVVFEVRESQKQEHFHVPLLLSPFSFTTYRGS